MSKLLNSLKKEGYVDSNVALTDNGAKSNASTLDKVLDMFANFGAYRGKPDKEVIDCFRNAFNEDQPLALKALFYFRDREGQGERKIFRTCLNWLAKEKPALVLANLENIPFYGRWDDILGLLDTNLKDQVIDFIDQQLANDIQNLDDGNSISLASKWLPSLNTSSAESRRQARLIARGLNFSDRQYRKTLVKLRSALNIVETQMSQKDWESVNYNIVPSRASMIYRKAFVKHDPVRYAQWQSDVKKGVKGAKVNASVLYPYDIINQLSSGSNDTLELQWNALPNYLADKDEDFLCVVDVSGSMESRLPKSKVTCMDVAVSLGLYCAERSKGAFKNHFITFSDSPELVEVKGKTLYTKVQNMRSSNWSGSTNLMAAFDLILNIAIKRRLSQKDLPSTLMIVSDMEFNCACRNNSFTNFELAKKKFQQAGYKLPRVVFWRVNTITKQAPVTKNEINTVLISGFSPTILTYLFNYKVKTSLDQMYKVLNAERYARVVTTVTSQPVRSSKSKKNGGDDWIIYTGQEEDEDIAAIEYFKNRQTKKKTKKAQVPFKTAKQKRDRYGRFLKTS